MNAVLHEYPISCYEVVYKDSKTLELSGETVVPDKMADIGVLCDTNAEALLRVKDVQKESVSLQGDLLVTVSYIPDGKGGLCGLTMNLPWEAVFQEQTITQGAFPIVEIKVEHMENRMLNPRKILFQCKLLISVIVYDRQVYQLYDEIEGNGMIQGCVESGEYSLVSTVCERKFAATDEYPVPPSIMGGEIIGKSVCFRVDDIKTLANKLIVKGTADSDVLLAAEKGEVEHIHFSSGFSFISETECERVSDVVSVFIVPTAMYYELSAGGKTLSAEVHGVCQMVVYEKKQLRYISDAYSHFYPYECTYGELPVLTERKITAHREKHSGTIICRSQVGKVCHTSVSHKIERQGERAVVSFRVAVCVKYEGGQYDWMAAVSEAEITGEKQGELKVHVWDVRTAVLGNEVEYHITFDCETIEENRCMLKRVLSVSYDEEAPLADGRPSLIAVRAGGRLWNLAGRYGSTVEQIKTYNQIETDAVPQGTFLLIPKQRLP